MKRLISHIGVAKTGTSLIQMQLAKYGKYLASDYGFYYPESASTKMASKGKVTTGNGAFLAKWLNSNTPVPGYEINWSPHSIFNEDKTSSDIIFSSEYLMGFQDDRFHEFIAISKEYGYSVELVVYLRSIAGHALSSYAQHVKRAHYSDSFEVFINKDYKNVFWPLLKKIYRFNDVVSYSIFNYDNYRDDLAKHFFEKVLSVKGVNFRKEVINRSLSLSELQVIRLLNQYSKRLKGGKALTSQVADYILEKYPDRETIDEVSTKCIDLLMNRYEKQLNWINENLPPNEKLELVDIRLKVVESTGDLSKEERHIVEVFGTAFDLLLNRYEKLM